MEELKRFDLVKYGTTHAVIVESDLLPPDASVVVVPLLRDYPNIKGLNPILEIDGEPFTLATRLIVAVQRKHLRHVGSLESNGDHIMRALDYLITGI